MEFLRVAHILHLNIQVNALHIIFIDKQYNKKQCREYADAFTYLFTNRSI